MDYSVFSASPLFRGINPGHIADIFLATPHRLRKYKSGSLIFQGGEQVVSMCFVVSGYVKGEMTDFTGRVIKIEDIRVPGALAPAFMFGQRNRYPVNVIAVADTELLVIEKSAFLELLKNNNTILVNFLDMISNRSQFLSDKIRFLNFKTIRGKLAQYILELASDGRNEVRLDRTQEDLADWFGVARPSVARALGELEEMGLVETTGKNIVLLNRKGLAELTRD
jgi:CRP/FNR family transcriptional regulator, dissimilatory nitrate respiration regulator